MGSSEAKRKWGHLIISPDYVPPVMDDERDDKGDIKTGRTLGQTYSSSDLFPNCGVNMSLSWFYEIPDKNPFVGEHVHDVDELVFFMPNYEGKGDDINAEWGEADFYIDGEAYTITRNSCIYCPAGLKHCPIVFRKITRPFCLMTILLADDYVREQAGKIVKNIGGKFIEVGNAPARNDKKE